MRKIGISLLLIGIIFLAQSRVVQGNTVWGPGNNYQIAYIHSGKLEVDNQTLLDFDKLPVTEFTLKNITNTAYDYIYRGYNNQSFYGHVEMKIVSFPGYEPFEFPEGFPVMLPLIFNDKDNWILSFAQKIEALSGLISDDMGENLISAEVEVTSNDVIFYTNNTLNATSLSSIEIIKIPIIGLDAIDGSLEQVVQTTKISYRRSTGVLYRLDSTITSSNYTDIADNNINASIIISQSLEFVAIIPAAPALLEDTININNFWIFALLIPLLKRRTK